PYTVIKYNSPFNFSKINNIGASNASGDYLLFLNDDTAPLESNWLSEMLSLGLQKNIGIVGPKLVLGNNTIQHAGLTFLKTGAGFHPLQGVDSDSAGYFYTLNVVRNFSAVTGACLLINKKIFDQVGGFSEEFDLYYGDADLCLKVLKYGYRVVYTPYAKLLHQGSSSIKEQTRSFFAVENHYMFIKKWPYLKNGDPFYNPNLTWDYRIDEKSDYMME
ncbi:MAG: glycosyltransferase, partial [Nitrosopumilales archaeon]